MMNVTKIVHADAVNPHVRFDEGDVAPAMPWRGSLLRKWHGMVGVAALAVASCAWGDYVEKDGYYVFDVASGTETCDTTLSGANGVKKLGGGTLVLTQQNTFTGQLIINNGTLEVPHGKCLGVPSKVVIAKDAVLNVQEKENTYGTSSGDEPIFPASTRMEVAGKIIRYAGFSRNYTFKDFHLTDNAALELTGSENRTTGLGGGGGGIYLQGHTLTVDNSSAGSLHFGLCGTIDPNGGRASSSDHGGVCQKAGTMLMQSLSSVSGDTNNVWELQGGHIKFWNNTPAVPWTLNVTGTGSISAGDAFKNTWSGPIFVRDGATLTTSITSYDSRWPAGMTLSGPVTLEGTSALYVTQTKIGGNKTTFTGPIASSGGGRIDVTVPSTDCRVCFSNDFNLSSGATFAKSGVGPVEFAGRTNIFGKAVDGAAGEVRFTGADYVRFMGHFITSSGSHSDVEFRDVGYVHLNYNIYVRGPDSNPSHLSITNAVLGHETPWTSILVPDFPGCAGYVDAYADTLITNDLTIGGYQDHATSRGRGAYRQWGGKFVFSSDSVLGMEKAHNGYYALNGGETDYVAGNSPGFKVGGKGSGFCEIRDGVFRNHLVVIAEHSGYGQLRMTGGTMNPYVLYLGYDGTAVESEEPYALGLLALSGANTRLTLGDRLTRQLNASNADYVIAVNDGARFESLRVGRANSNRARLLISVDGGVLVHSGNSAGDWYNGSAYRPESFLVHEGGIVFDPAMTGNTTNNYATMSSDLCAPTGHVVVAIAMPPDAAFQSEKYLGPAQVKISGVGSGAYACVDYDDLQMKPTNITVVAKGTGYAAEGTTAQIASADGKTWYACAVTVAPAPTTGAGLVKRGAQKTELTGVNTYHGDTRVEGGFLKLTGEGALPAQSGLFVAKGATVDLGGIARTVPTLGGAGTVKGSLTVTNAITGVCGATSLALSGTLTFGDGATLTVENPEQLDKDVLNAVVRANAFDGPLPKLVGLGDSWRLVKYNDTLALRYVRGLVIILQ